VVSINPHK